MNRNESRSEGQFGAIIEAMRDPAFYPDHTSAVEVRETHISFAFLTDNFVYKLKKPIKFPFLDYSTLDRRRHFCQEEVRLNRRLASGVYLGVSAIVPRAGGFALEAQADENEVAEYAVKMRRLPENRMLSHLACRGQVPAADIEALVRKLADFHATAPTDKALLYGNVAGVERRLMGNLDELSELVGDNLSAERLEHLRAWTLRQVSHRRELIEWRARSGRVCEGHGDLRAEHVCFETGGTIEVLDCVEFDEALRYGDVASEVAFLTMDLERLGATSLAGAVADAYIQATGDTQLRALLPLYQCFRALIRAKVQELKSRAENAKPLVRAEAGLAARRAFELACRYAQTADRAALILVCGLSGSGKSTLAARLGSTSGLAVFNSDVVRKQLAGLPSVSDGSAAFGQGIYSAESTERTYRELIRCAQKELAKGQAVVIDATFGDRRHRAAALDLAARHDVQVLFIECRADEAETLRRLQRRASQGGSVSDADEKVYFRQRESFVPLDEVPSASRVVVCDEQTLLEAMARAQSLL